MKDKKKIIFNAVFLILCFSLTLFYVFKGEDFKTVLRFIRRAGGTVWLVGILLVTAFILCESLIICYLMKNEAETEAVALLSVLLCGFFL